MDIVSTGFERSFGKEFRMFGYVRPCKDELKVREYENYKAMYCGLCHVLSSRYGFLARFILNYDFSFLALTLSSAAHCDCIKCRKRCIASPVRKKVYYAENDALLFSADANVILTYFKLKDSIVDDGFWKALGSRVLSWILYPAYRKAKRLRPSFAEACRTDLAMLRDIETENVASIDAAADAFAKIIASASEFASESSLQRPLDVLFYHIGRFIYIVDAWDDMADDRKKGNYNPIVLRYAIDDATDLTEIRNAIAITLENSCSTAAGAAELIDFDENEAVIKNVLYLGLPMTAKAVLNGRKNKGEK